MCHLTFVRSLKTSIGLINTVEKTTGSYIYSSLHNIHNYIRSPFKSSGHVLGRLHDPL